jgi:hypothetical protein
MNESITPIQRISLNCRVAFIMLLTFKFSGLPMQFKGIGRALHDIHLLGIR